MRVLIISDTHRCNDFFFQVLEKIGQPDLLIHCGDIAGSEYVYSQAVNCEVKMVAGNNDFFSDLKPEEEFEIDGLKVWLTHGHYNYVSLGNERLIAEAASRGADIVMYGHTHRPLVEYDDMTGVIAVNPGSLAYPRQEGHRPSYILMETDKKGEPHFTINYV